jgi:hypothetical protein
LWLALGAASFYSNFRRVTMIRAFAAENNLETVPLNFFTKSAVLAQVTERMPSNDKTRVRLLASISRATLGFLLIVILLGFWLKRSGS